MDSSGSGDEPVGVSCECIYEPEVPIKCEKLLMHCRNVLASEEES